MKTEELAVIEGIDLGCRDTSTPMMWFTAKCLHSVSLQCISWEDAFKILKESGVSSFKELEGRPCVVECEDRFVKFLRIME